MDEVKSIFTSAGSGSENMWFRYHRLDNFWAPAHLGFNLSFNFVFGFWPLEFHRVYGFEKLCKIGKVF